MNDVTLLLIRLVVITASMLITLFAVPYLKTLRESKEFELIIGAVSKAVNYAEQTIKGSGMGPTKKEEVIDVVNDYLKIIGVNLSPALLDVLIEDAVYVMNSNKK